jgi:hypothetical protein
MGDTDGFVARYDAAGNELWIRQLGNLLTAVTGRPSAVMRYLNHNLNDLGAGDLLPEGSFDVLSKLTFSCLAPARLQ